MFLQACNADVPHTRGMSPHIPTDPKYRFPPAGKVLGGMKLTPCGGYMVYPLGSILVVRSMAGKNKQAFLEGHTADISCVAMTCDGSRIVSGQVGVLIGAIERECGCVRRAVSIRRPNERVGTITIMIDAETLCMSAKNTKLQQGDVARRILLDLNNVLVAVMHGWG